MGGIRQAWEEGRKLLTSDKEDRYSKSQWGADILGESGLSGGVQIGSNIGSSVSGFTSELQGKALEVVLPKSAEKAYLGLSKKVYNIGVPTLEKIGTGLKAFAIGAPSPTEMGNPISQWLGTTFATKGDTAFQKKLEDLKTIKSAPISFSGDRMIVGSGMKTLIIPKDALSLIKDPNRITKAELGKLTNYFAEKNDQKSVDLLMGTTPGVAKFDNEGQLISSFDEARARYGDITISDAYKLLEEKNIREKDKVAFQSAKELLAIETEKIYDEELPTEELKNKYLDTVDKLNALQKISNIADKDKE
jgi:hypothetical protein